MRKSQIVFALARIRALAADSSGIAAVEFAYIAPLLILMTFGTFEVSRALIVNKRFQRTTAMVGDLVAREKQLGTTSAEAKTALDGIMQSAQFVMAPYSSTPLKIGVYQLRAPSNNPENTTVEWSYGYNGMIVTPCPNSKAMPATNMIGASNAAIVVVGQYQYAPLFATVVPGFGNMSWTDTMTFAPRYGSVFYGQSTQNTTCPS